jgi:tRNA(Ile)-lysidine synthase TilS/MesJ
MKNYKLCYIEKNFAYFTTQDLDKQTGDDWDDAPYEHNAGTPYTPHRSYSYMKDGEWARGSDYNEDGTPKWEIYKVAYDYCGAETPAEIAGSNSRYSVDMINAKLIPWLTVLHWGVADHWQSEFEHKALFAGASVEEFITFIEECGGTVYLPRIKVCSACNGFGFINERTDYKENSSVTITTRTCKCKEKNHAES